MSSPKFTTPDDDELLDPIKDMTPPALNLEIWDTYEECMTKVKQTIDYIDSWIQRRPAFLRAENPNVLADFSKVRIAHAQRAGNPGLRKTVSSVVTRKGHAKAQLMHAQLLEILAELNTGFTQRTMGFVTKVNKIANEINDALDSLDPKPDTRMAVKRSEGGTVTLQVDFTQPRSDVPGGTSVLYVGHDVDNPSKEYMVKCVRRQRWKGLFEDEAKAWEPLRHPNLLQLFGLGEWDRAPALVSEYQPRGSLWAYVSSSPSPGEVFCRIKLLQGASCGLDYLHTKRMVHGDVKAQNVLLKADGTPVWCDFGLTKKDDSVTVLQEARGQSPRYVCPERVHGGPRTFAADVYAFGMMIFQVLTGVEPYPEIEEAEAVPLRVLNKKVRPKPLAPTKAVDGTGVSYEVAWILAQQCWETKPDRRPSMAYVYARIGLSKSEFRK